MVDVHYDSPFEEYYGNEQDPFSYYEKIGIPSNSKNPGVPYYVGTALADDYTKNKRIQDMLLAGGNAASSARLIPGQSDARAAEYERYRNLVGNYGNAQAYDQRSQDLASMLSGGPGSDVYNNIYGSIKNNALNTQQKTQQAASQTGLNRVASARLGRDAQYDYMRGAQQKAQAGQALADQQRAMSAAEMLNTGISSRTGRGMDALNRKSQDQQMTEDVYLRHLDDAIKQGSQRDSLYREVNRRRDAQNDQLLGAMINAGAAGASYFGSL